jgi:hypothetical protein
MSSNIVKMPGLWEANETKLFHQISIIEKGDIPGLLMETHQEAPVGYVLEPLGEKNVDWEQVDWLTRVKSTSIF